MFTGPAFTTIPARTSAGDFLGMGAVGERLYGGIFPGLNNAARHIRPYSAICWMMNNIQKSAFCEGKADIAELRRKTQLGLWKMQLLLNWVAKLDGLQGYPGVERFEGDPKSVELRRETWPNIKVSFWDTAWYKPSLLNGLRFLDEGTNEFKGTYSCTKAGLLLAEAYDEAVQTLNPKLVKWLADCEALTCTKKQVEELRPVLGLANPTPAERKAFLRQYFYAEFSQADDGGKLRRKGLLLALRTVAALQDEETEATVEVIRHTMAAGVTPLGYAIDVSGLEMSQAQWAVLQVRALQRLAMETLLGLTERHILWAEQERKPRRNSDIAGTIAAYLAPSKSNSLYQTVEKNYHWIQKAQGNYETVQAAGLTEANDDINLIDLKAQLRGNVGPDMNNWPAAARQAIWTLIVCAVEADNLSQIKGAKRLLAWDEGKLSLLELASSVKRFMKEPVEAFTRHVVQSFVIRQHLLVAAERSVISLDGKDRFVFSQESDGLTRFADASAARFFGTLESGDILFHALLFLENSAKLRFIKSEEASAISNRLHSSFLLTKSGHKLLETTP